MKNIILFGFGQMGKKLIDECLNYEMNIALNAIADNNASESSYRNIPVIKPREIKEYCYDEIWICTVYFKEIMEQLSCDYGIDKEKMFFIEPVVPVLESRLRQKYETQLKKSSSVSGELGEVLGYLKSHHLRMYCYPFYDEYLQKNSEIQYDNVKGLYYGVYENKKMYLARRFNTLEKARAYFNAVTMEQDMKSPHCYWNNEKLCKIDDVGVDVGAAEGIFALKIIEKIKHIYLIEVDEQWIEALQYTFEDYTDKITIINTYIGNEVGEGKARLDTVLLDAKIDFIKMDIEGMEYEALRGAEKILSNNDVQLAICVYHHQDDNEKIGQWLRDRKYYTSNSGGLVVCQGDWELEKDKTDFRKALLFANK